MLATSETAAAAMWYVLQGGTGERTRKNGQGTIAPPSSRILVFGGSLLKRCRVTLEGADSMTHLGDVSGDAADTGGRWLALSKSLFPRVISLMNVCEQTGRAEDVLEVVSRDLTTKETTGEKTKRR
jgi:hypothetical protein